jgi:hypothetical protein
VLGVPVSPASNVLSTDVFLPIRDSSNVCSIVVRLDVSNAVRAARVANVARPGVYSDPCYWYRVYGMPGRGMQAVIDSTRAHVLAVHRPTRGTFSDTSLFRLLARSDPRWPRCGASDLSICENLVTGGPRGRTDVIGQLRTPGWIGTGRSYFDYAELAPALLLSEAEAELGPQAFSALWRSDAPFPDAFAKARGMPLGEWVRRLVEKQPLVHRSGPTPPNGLAIVLAVFIPGLIGLGIRGAGSRR